MQADIIDRGLKPRRGGGGGGGVCFHIYLDILGCAAMKGIVFKQFSLGEDIETRE